MRRAAAALVPLLLLASAPAAVATGPECGADHYVDSLQLSVTTTSGTHRAGRATTVPVTVTRAGLPAPDVEVFLQLRAPTRKAALDQTWATTDAEGRALLSVRIPRQARGALAVQVEGERRLASFTCLAVHEHGAATSDWGRVAT